MSLDDRDWWREDRRKKEELYGGDFSLNSKPIYKPLRDDTFTDIDYTLKPKRNSGNVTKIDVLSAILALSVWTIGLLIGVTFKYIVFGILLCIAVPVLARHCRSVDKYAWLNALLITFIIMVVIVFDFGGIVALLHG